MESKPVADTEVESSLYDSDFFEWTQYVGEALRQGHLSQADLEHVAEEIVDMGKRDRREVYSRMTVLLMHLMKWATQPERREGATWDATITEQREQLFLILRDSPSLRVHLIREMPAIYSRAAEKASEETRLPVNTFTPPDALQGRGPQIDQLLSFDWYPEKMDDLFLLT